MKILVVEDEPFVAEDIVSKLEKLGYRVIAVAENYDDALNAVDAERPDLVLLDIELQGSLNGFDVSKQLAMKDIPFIYLTGIGDQGTFYKAYDTNPEDFLSKPIDSRNLQNAILGAIIKRSKKKSDLTIDVFVDKNNNMCRINPMDIIYVKAGRAYCDVHFAKHKTTLTLSMKAFLEKLKFRGMVSIGKSCTINLEHYVRQQGNDVTMSNNEVLRITNKTQLDKYMEKYR